MTDTRRLLVRAGAAAALVAVLGSDAAWGQRSSPLVATQLLATRESLQRRLWELETGSTNDAGAVALIRGRLEAGDFRQGDRILLVVESEEQLSDTFVVESNAEVRLPTIGSISLAGVLRSELEGHLVRHIGRYLREPRVHARPLIGFSVTGEVAEPGFHWVPADALLADILVVAGGATREAKMDDVRIERGGKRILDAKGVERALAANGTINDIGLQPGDRLVVPSAGGTSTYTLVRTVSIILSVPLTIFSLTKIFGG